MMNLNTEKMKRTFCRWTCVELNSIEITIQVLHSGTEITTRTISQSLKGRMFQKKFIQSESWGHTCTISAGNKIEFSLYPIETVT